MNNTKNSFRNSMEIEQSNDQEQSPTYFPKRSRSLVNEPIDSITHQSDQNENTNPFDKNN